MLRKMAEGTISNRIKHFLPIVIVVVVDVVKCLTFYSLSGTLVSEFLKRDCNQTPQDYCQSVLSNAHLYSGFNLITARIKYWDM